MLRLKKTYRQTGDTLSRRVFVVMAWTTALVFALFWLVGYDTPYAENCNFIAPLFTDVLIGFVAVVLVAAIALMVWAVTRSLRMRGKGGRVVNNIKAKKIAYITAGAVAAVMVTAFVCGSSDEMVINGNRYRDAMWLKIADMFVWTVLVLVTAGLAVIIIATVWNGRRKR